MTTDQLIMAWKSKNAEIKKLQAEELALRKEVLQSAFEYNENDEREGVRNLELGMGYKLKGTFKLTRSLDKTKVNEVLTKMEKKGIEGRMFAERLVKFDPKLSVSEYKNLPDEYREMIDEAITTKPALPTLQLVEPKGK